MDRGVTSGKSGRDGPPGPVEYSGERIRPICEDDATPVRQEAGILNVGRETVDPGSIQPRTDGRGIAQAMEKLGGERGRLTRRLLVDISATWQGGGE